MAKAIITVENTQNGFSIMIRTSDNAMIYPEILITRDQRSQEASFEVFKSIDESISGTSYKEVYYKLEDEPKARDFLQMGYLVYKQKTAQYQSEIEQLVGEILSM